MAENSIYLDITSVNDTATTTEQSFDFRARNIFFMSNDGVETIIVNFDRDTTERGAVLLEAGDVINNMPLLVKDTVYIKTVSGTSAFRIIGLVD